MTKKLHTLSLTLIALLIILPSCSKKSNVPEEGKNFSFNLFNMKKEPRDFNKSVEKTVYTWIDSIPLNQYFPESGIGNELTKEFREYYRTLNYKVNWSNRGGLNEKAQQVIAFLEKVDNEGLNPENYYLEDIRHAQKSPVMGSTPEQVAKLDFLVTSAILKYADHMLIGRIRPTAGDKLWMIYSKDIDLSDYLSTAVKEDNVIASLKALEPSDPQYAALREKLFEYKKIKNDGGWEPLSPDIRFERGDTSEYVVLLKNRLQKTGFLPSTVTVDNIFDSDLEAAVRKAQQSFGLRPTGEVDEKTIKELNVPVDKRIDQIMVNMERMRWVPEIKSKRLVRVNIPNYYVTVYEDGKEAISMKVIVGKTFHSTPIFIDTMEYVVFSPTWSVPMSIARNEMLPKIKKDPGYLARNHYSLYNRWTQDAKELDPYSIDWSEYNENNFNFRIVQDPGHYNALGLVKFMFPNRFSIYLHDTPSDYLFEKENRSFSHGCIRVEKPAELANYLLKESGWDMEKVRDYMSKERPATILLPEKIPVEILYYTAFLDNDGLLHFRTDVYGYDEYQIKKMHELNDKKL